MKATDEQREQIHEFFTLIDEFRDDLLLYPCRDRKTDEVRLAICVADRENDIIYVKGLYFLPGDKMFGRFELVEDEPDVLTAVPPGIIGRLCRRLAKWWCARKL